MLPQINKPNYKRGKTTTYKGASQQEFIFGFYNFLEKTFFQFTIIALYINESFDYFFVF